MPVAPFLQVNAGTHPVTVKHYYTLPNIKFNIRITFGVGKNAFLPGESACQVEQCILMHELGRRIALLGVPVAATWYKPLQTTTLMGLARFHTATDQGMCWNLRQHNTDIRPNPSTDNEGNQLSTMEVVSPWLEWYDIGPDRYGRVACVMAEINRIVNYRIWLPQYASLKVCVRIEPGNKLALNMKRILTLTLVLEQLALWPVTLPERQDRLGWLIKDSCFCKAATDMPQNQGPSFIDADREARADLPEFSDLAFANIIKNIWRCNTPAEIIERLKPLPGSPNLGLVIVEPRPFVDGEYHMVAFLHAQASARIDFVKNWTDLCASITRAAFLPSPAFKNIMSHMLRCYRHMKPSAEGVVTPAQACYALDILGDQMRRYWPVQIAGRYFQRELSAHADGKDLDKDGTAGWAKFA